MTNYCIPMRSINGDRKVGSKEWRSVFRAFFNNGIFPNPSTNFQVLENGNMTTRVGQGIAFVNGVFVMEDTDLFFEHDLADAVLKRIDSIVIRLDDVARTIKPVLVKGTPSSTPVPPAITRTADRWEIVLAYVFIDAGAVEITQADISDTRLDTELCGIVSGAVDQVDTTTIFNQYESWFNNVKDGTEQEIEDWQQLQYQNFLDWFATIQDILDGDVAANLASQIAQTNNNLTLLENKVDSHLAESNQQFYRLSKQSNTLQREVAYLKLMQDAQERIDGGTLFANDFKGNEFGITFDEQASTNARIKNGGIVMAEIDEATVTRDDVTVINQAYDTSGNGGRKLVRLSNGWLVAVVSSGTQIIFYKSSDNGQTWSQLTYVGYSNPSGFAIVSKGTNIYLIMQAAAVTSSRFLKFDATNVSNADQVSNSFIPDSSQTAFGSVSLITNEAGTELHATWSSKNSTYPNSFNIRYAKGTINADGSVTWGAVEQLTTQNDSSKNYASPSIVLAGNTPVILYSGVDNSSAQYIGCLRKTSTWSNNVVGSATTYAQSSPSAIYVPSEISGTPNGRIWVAWTNNYVINVSYSDDLGLTWRAPTVVNESDVGAVFPSITVNADNEVFISYAGKGAGSTSYRNIVISKLNGTTWNVVSNLTNQNVTNFNYSSTLVDFDINFTHPLVIFTTANKVGFYGTWVTEDYTPSLASTAVFDIEGDTDFVGVFVQKQGDITVQAYFNNTLMDDELDGNEYQFTKQLINEAPAKLRLELSRPNTTNGNNDKITRILGGIA